MKKMKRSYIILYGIFKSIKKLFDTKMIAKNIINSITIK